MCGGNFHNLLIPLASVVEAQIAPAVMSRNTMSQGVCSQCKSPVLPDFAWCPKCGATLKPHPCAYCGRMLPPEELSCPSCGAPSRGR